VVTNEHFVLSLKSCWKPIQLLIILYANIIIKNVTGIYCRWYQSNIFFPSNLCSKRIQPLIIFNPNESDNSATNYMQHITIHELFFIWRKKNLSTKGSLKCKKLIHHMHKKKKKNECTTLLIYDVEVKRN
jgi:hypothetical protein